jgi:hypothetical protein
MSPTGGKMLNLPAFVSSVLPAGTLMLVDAAQVAGSQQGYAFDSSDAGLVEMSDIASNNVVIPTGSTSVSAYQGKLIEIRAVSYFGVERIGPHSVGVIQGVDWSPLQGT